MKPEEKKEEEKVDEKPEEKKEEPKAEDVAEKMTDSIAAKVAKILEGNKIKKDDEKTKDLVFDDKAKIIVDPEVKTFKLRRANKYIMMRHSEINSLAKWFKNWATWKKTGRPDYFAEMKSEYEKLEKMAMVQKLEPLRTDVAAEGGNIVPTILSNHLIDLVEDIAQIRQFANVLEATGTKTLDLAGIASNPITKWNNETYQKGTTSLEFNKISLTPYILAGIIAVTQQLIDDSPFNVVQLVGQKLAKAIATAEDAAFASGSGVGQPTGIDTYTPGYTIAAGGALTWQHLNSAYFGLPGYYRSRATWIVHKDTLALLANLADTQNRPILDMSMALGGGQLNIRGNRVIENNDISNNIIYLVDLSEYYIAYSRQLSIDTATEATIGGVFDSAKGGGTYLAPTNLWERNMIAIRAEEKVDGELGTTRALATVTAIRT